MNKHGIKVTQIICLFLRKRNDRISDSRGKDIRERSLDTLQMLQMLIDILLKCASK